jgi:hypothetical protein
MKATVTFNLYDSNIRLFRSMNEWVSYSNSLKAGYQQVWTDPEKFPCIAITTHHEWNANGRDWEHHYFIYDFTLTEDEE